MTALPTRSDVPAPRHDGFPHWPDDIRESGMQCEWRVCGKDHGDLTADVLTHWMDTYDEAQAYLRDAPGVYYSPPYEETWIEARWYTEPERVAS